MQLPTHRQYHRYRYKPIQQPNPHSAIEPPIPDPPLLVFLIPLLRVVPAIKITLVSNHEPSDPCECIHQIDRIDTDNPCNFVEEDPALVVRVLTEGGLVVRV